MKPAGALTRQEYKHLPLGSKIYYVKHCINDDQAHAGHSMGELGQFKYDGWSFGRTYWFGPGSEYGHFFTNYFHALAYSLKVKHEANHKPDHSQPAHP